MDEEDFSSCPTSSHNYNKHHLQYYCPPCYYSGYTLDPPSTTTTTSSTPTHHGGSSSSPSTVPDFSFSPDILLSSATGKWASDILMEAARAFSDKNTTKLHQLLWMLNELGSPYGDVEQKLVVYFNQALLARLNATGPRHRTAMLAAADKTSSFDSIRKLLLKFQEVSPWTTFGHVACNGAIIEAFEGDSHGKSKLHVIDISTTFCTQWPTLLEALATRMDDTPHLTLTAVIVNKYAAVEGGDYDRGRGSKRVMREIGVRLEKFARLMGVPFKFNVVHHEGDLSGLDFSLLDIKDDEVVAINCVSSLHSVDIRRRDAVLAAFVRLRPRVVTMLEEEAELTEVGEGQYEFLRGFEECLRWFRVYFEALEDCFPRTSNEKLMLERAGGRAMVDLLACPEPDGSAEQRETARRWSGRMHGAGFEHVGFSEEVCDDVRALLRRYKEGWSMAQCTVDGGAPAGIFLSWRDQPVVWASAWRP